MAIRTHSDPITGAVCAHHADLFRGAAFWLGPGATSVYIGCMSETGRITTRITFPALEWVESKAELIRGVEAFSATFRDGE